jgi:hypothetical protein
LIATTLTLRSTVSLALGNNYAAVVYLTPATLLSTAPTGNITLTATPTGGSPSTIATVTPAQAMANGGYTVSVPTTIATTYTITATYPGDANYAAAAPVTSTTTVLGIATTLAPSALFPTAVPNYANSISLLLKTASGTVSPTGNVLLSVTPSTGVTLSPASITAAQAVSGSNVVNITYPANGVYTVTGAYSGDSIYSASSFTQTVTVQPYASSITLSGPATGTTPAAPVSFQLLLSDASHNKYQAPAATGNVVITSLSTTGVAGPGATVAAALASGTSGTAVPLQFTQAGTYTVTAAYAGDTANLPSQATAQIVITATTAPTFVMTLTGSSSFNINNAPSTTSVTLTAYSGFNTPVAFTFLNNGDTPPDTQSCCVITLTDAVTGLPVTNVTPTTAGAKINITFAKAPNASRLSSPYARVPGALACAVFCLTFVAFRRRGVAFQLKLLAAILIVAAAGTSLAGCGSGQSVLIVATPINNSQGTVAPQSVLVMVSY